MPIALIAGLIPTLVSTVKGFLPSDNAQDDHKKMVQDILKALYEKFLKGHIPDFPGVDEEELFVTIFSYLIDFELARITK